MTSPKLIVLVDDNKDFADLIIECIGQNTDYKVVHFASGQQAFEFLNKDFADVVGIFSDLMMGDMDGIDFLAALRESEAYGHLPVIIISGANPIVFEGLLKPHRYSAFVEKPVDRRHLIKLVKTHFGWHQFVPAA